jgi:taurine dioxygenase
MVTVNVPRRFLDFFPPMGPRTLVRVPHGWDDRPYELFGLRPLGPVIGAEVDVDLRQAPSEDVQRELHRAFIEWKVLVFRSQDLSADQLSALAACFGETFDDTVLGYPELYEAPNVIRGETTGFQNYWHADTTYWRCPGLATVIQVEGPAVGGDTLFADMAAAYDNLPDDVKEAIEPLRAVHDVAQYATEYHHHPEIAAERYPPVEHPVVRTHPVTKRKTLFVNAQWTREIVGLDREVGDALLVYLCAQATVPEFQCRIQWGRSAVGLWDNRAVQHYAVGDYSERRTLLRTTVRGDEPY